MNDENLITLFMTNPDVIRLMYDSIKTNKGGEQREKEHRKRLYQCILRNFKDGELCPDLDVCSNAEECIAIMNEVYEEYINEVNCDG